MNRSWPSTVSLVILLALSPFVLAGPEIAVKALFSNKAILEINGVDRMVRAGERTEEGVLLISCNAKGAIIEVDGVARPLGLTGQIASTFTESKLKEVRIPQSPDSHFRVNGAINGYPVEMMVDTGATAVAMNANDAERFGIDYQNGDVGHSTTAAGPVRSYLVDLDRVNVGSIAVFNIKGVVIEGEYPSQVLLGNSFLSHVNMEQDSGALVLKSKF